MNLKNQTIISASKINSSFICILFIMLKEIVFINRYTDGSCQKYILIDCMWYSISFRRIKKRVCIYIYIYKIHENISLFSTI